MEDALRASEQNFRLIVESIPAPNVTFTAQAQVEYANQRTVDYTGWSATTRSSCVSDAVGRLAICERNGLELRQCPASFASGLPKNDSTWRLTTARTCKERSQGL